MSEGESRRATGLGESTAGGEGDGSDGCAPERERLVNASCSGSSRESISPRSVFSLAHVRRETSSVLGIGAVVG